MKIISLLLLLLMGAQYAYACTSAVIGSSRTATGEVILWKNRDSSTRNTMVSYVTGGKYPYVALTTTTGKTTYGGMNSTGFGIINNTVSNLIVGSTTGSSRGTHPYSLMVTALRECTTVDEFEEMVKTTYLPRKTGYQSIVGVCDAQGGAAFFEINDTSYVRYDAKDNNGYVLRANFGFSGDASQRGTSERRYNLMKEELASHTEPFTVQDFVDYSRSFKTYSMGDVLEKDDIYIDENYTVPRSSTCDEFVIVSGPNPRIFISNGNPMVGMLMPIYVGAKIPASLGADGAMYQASEAYLSKAYYKDSNNKTVLNKSLVRKIKELTYTVVDPVQKPEDTDSFANSLDSIYTDYVKKVWDILNGVDGISSVEVDATESNQMFNLQGQPVATIGNGVTIVRSKGKTTKIYRY